MIAPQFKTWFYIYRNNTVEEDFKKTLVEDYLVEVKDIDRIDFNFDSPRTAEQNDDSVKQTNSKDVTQFEELKNTEPKEETGPIEGFDTLKFVDDTSSSVEQAIADYDQLDKGEKVKVTKFDRDVDDTQYVEVPEIKKELKGEKDSSEKNHLRKKLEKENEGPHKVTLPLKKYMEDSMEIMEAQETRNFANRVINFSYKPVHADSEFSLILA